jgi:hypothetical protein
MQCHEVLRYVAAEVGRIVGVHRHLHALFQHLQDIVLAHVIEHAELGVRQRADRKRNLLGDQPFDQFRVL